MSKHRMRIALDVDDVLMPCTSLAVDMANKEYGFENPITLDEITGWGKTGHRTDIILKYYKDQELYRKQTLYPGAKELVDELSKYAEIFFVTAVEPEAMTIRATMLREYFPNIPANHIIMSSKKDVVNTDIILDDNPNHILDSNAPYPVLMRRPWNYYLTGLLAVNTYDEFLRLVKEIINRYTHEENISDIKPRIIALVGPSGSGKNEIIDKLQMKGFIRLKSYTTKRPKHPREHVSYHIVSKNEFIDMKNKGMFFETSIYAGDFYGTKLSDLEDLLKTDKKIVLPIDVAGAIALKSQFSDLCATVYVKKDKKEIIKNILKAPYTDEEKANRLISLNAEYKNKDICNYTICNNSTEEAANKIIELFTKHKEEN